MPLCGFNQEMLEGINKFHKGLVEHGIIERSHKKNQSTEETIQIELEDMRDFLKETHHIKDPEIRELTEALAKYASAYYRFIQKRELKNYNKGMQFLSNFFYNMDEKYYSELEGTPQAMKKLALYLNEFNPENSNEN